MKSQIMRIKSTDNCRKLIKFVYIRYADDWRIISNSNKEIMEQIKSYIEKWLKDKLKLNLSIEKTKITNIEKEYCKFLGYRFSNNQN